MKKIIGFILLSILMGCSGDGGGVPGGTPGDGTGDDKNKPGDGTLPPYATIVSNQMRICGDITQSDTWNTDYTKYVITCNSRIMPNVSITVEPGATVEIYKDVRLTVAGSFDVVKATGGDKSARIMGGVGYDRAGILSFNSGGNHSLSFVVFQRMQRAIEVLSGQVNLDNIKIQKANYGIYNSGGKVVASNMLFKGISFGVFSSANTLIKSSDFDGKIGNASNFMIGVMGNTNVRESEFSFNKVAIESNGRVTSNTIRRCQTGVKPINGLVLKKNTFIRNGAVIRSRGAKSPLNVTIRKNNFMPTNVNVAVMTNTEQSLDIKNNYWGTLDLNEIEDKIIDFYDNTNNGVVNYTPVSPEPF